MLGKPRRSINVSSMSKCSFREWQLRQLPVVVNRKRYAIHIIKKQRKKREYFEFLNFYDLGLAVISQQENVVEPLTTLLNHRREIHTRTVEEGQDVLIVNWHPGWINQLGRELRGAFGRMGIVGWRMIPIKNSPCQTKQWILPGPHMFQRV